MIGAKRKLDLNGRGRVGAMDKSFMQEVLLLFVAVFQPNRPKVPICPEIGNLDSSTNFIAESGASRERSLTFIRSKTEKKCSPRTRNLREREFLEHQPRSQVNSLSAVVSSA